ncbi:MAG: T9SS type A sorting domain-containing protein, partial [Melioribacteraceae bacterium]|nr:T9SS type A sorting domain-containing protein [Melioribacteraceae bacterium]
SGEAFNNLDTGYVVNVTGVVEEYFQTTHLNLIEFKPEDIVDFVGRPRPIQLTLDSLNEIGTSNPNYLAEKWEHCFVELRNVTVSHAYSFGSGTYVIYDENGTKILVGNKSSYWRPTPIPEEGTKISRICGYIENRNNIDEYWFIINPVYPSDVEFVNSIQISLPVNEEVTYNSSNTTIEIPITTESLTDQNVISYQFTIEYDPTLVNATGISVEGTLSNQSGWSVLPNTLVDGEITVGAFGANPLNGEGELIKVVFEMTGLEGMTPLHFRDFVFNSGDPSAITTDGSINIVLGMCGDANEDQQIYAQDAAFTLQHSIGLIELTPQGANNADVNMDGSATAFDAALILRHVIGLPEPVATCFDEGGKKEGSIAIASEEELEGFRIYGSKIEEKEGGERKEIEMEYGGIEGVAGIYSISYEVEIKEGRGEVWIEQEGEGYLVEINRVDEKRVRVGIINGKGISSEEIRMKIGMKRGEEVEEIEISKIEINGIEKERMTLTNLVSGLEVTEYRLVGSYPNPFNPSTKVVYEIPENAKVNITVYDILGRKITELVNAEMEKGRHEIEWRGINNHNERVSSGTYIIMMRTNEYQRAVKVNMLK